MPARQFPQSIVTKGGYGCIKTLGDYKYGGQWVEFFQAFHNPALGVVDYVVTVVALNQNSSKTCTLAHDLSALHPRNVTVIASAAATSVVTITGYDQWGKAATEALTLNGTNSVAGSKIFSKVTSVVADKYIDGAANIRVGSGNKLGLLRKCLPVGAWGTFGGVLEATPPTLDATNHSVLLTSSLDGAHDVVVHFWSSDVV